jgi:Protein of unknown function (DUF3558)
MRFRPVTIALVAAPLAAVLLLAGCSSAGASGGSSSASSTSKAAAPKAAATKAAVASKPLPSNPCDLLTVAEASKAVGSPITSPFHAGNACTYNNEDYGFIVTVYSDGNNSWQASNIGMKAQFGKTPAISGLGDRAIGTGGVVDVQKGSTVIDVDDNYADKDPQLTHAKAIAAAVLANL